LAVVRRRRLLRTRTVFAVYRPGHSGNISKTWEPIIVRVTIDEALSNLREIAGEATA